MSNPTVTAPMVLRALTKDAKNLAGNGGITLAEMAGAAEGAGDGGACSVARTAEGALEAVVSAAPWSVTVTQHGQDVLVCIRDPRDKERWPDKALEVRYDAARGAWVDGDAEESDRFGLRGHMGEGLRSDPASPLWLLMRPEVARQLGTEDFLARVGAYQLHEALWRMTKAYEWGSASAEGRLCELGASHPDVMERWVLAVCREIMDAPTKWTEEVRAELENLWAHLTEGQERKKSARILESDGRGVWRVARALESLMERAEEDQAAQRAKSLDSAIWHATRAMGEAGGALRDRVHALWLMMELFPSAEWQAQALYAALGTIAEDYDPETDPARMSDYNAEYIGIYRLVRAVCRKDEPSKGEAR